MHACRFTFAVISLSLLAALTQRQARGDELPDSAALEAAGVVIGTIEFERHNVFDLSNPKEDRALYRLANSWHILTRTSVIRQQLLFASGDPYRARLIAESERLLRKNEYLYDARIVPVRVVDGVVDLRIVTRDVWTLMPGFSLSRSGGTNRLRFSMAEENLLGMGTRIKAAYSEDVDRNSTSFEYTDRNLGNSWVGLNLLAADNSDGESQWIRLARPFYALDSRWTAGVDWQHNDAEYRHYDLGVPRAEYRRERHDASIFAGWSDGLRHGWVRRFIGGIAYEDRDYSETASGELEALLPEDRRLLYPFLRFDLLQDRYATASNREQINRTEDFYVGTRVSAELGYASNSYGSDRDAVRYSLAASSAFGSIDASALFVSSSYDGRLEHGRAVNALWRADARYYRQLSRRALTFVTASGAYGKDLDLDNLLQLGGDNGLRGYPLRYQVGDRRLLLTAEYRYFTDWYPFRLVRVGGAAFADAGRTWGDNPAGGPPVGWLRDVGFGLRLALPRASDSDIIHIDVAFPLDGDASIDSVQFLIEKKASF